MLILLLWLVTEFALEEPLFREIHILKKNNPKIDWKIQYNVKDSKPLQPLKHTILSHQEQSGFLNLNYF